MSKSRIIIVSVVAVVLAVAAYFAGRALRSGESRAVGPAAEEEAQSRPIATVKRPAAGKQPKVIKLVNEKPRLDLSDDEESKRTPEEKRLAANIEKALDDEDFELAKQCVAAATKCKDVEIRQAMVDTLGWFGEKALPELTQFLADADEDVAQSAMDEWDSAVSAVEDDGDKVVMVELAMQVVANEDFLESISGEYIGTDEKLSVESLLRVIEGGGTKQGIAKAKETYEFVTGEEFVDRAAAEKWIAEEYQPPEQDE